MKEWKVNSEPLEVERYRQRQEARESELGYCCGYQSKSSRSHSRSDRCLLLQAQHKLWLSAVLSSFSAAAFTFRIFLFCFSVFCFSVLSWLLVFLLCFCLCSSLLLSYINLSPSSTGLSILFSLHPGTINKLFPYIDRQKLSESLIQTNWSESEKAPCCTRNVELHVLHWHREIKMSRATVHVCFGSLHLLISVHWGSRMVSNCSRQQ